MKKISVLIMLILCVTIGGVYAAWTYTDGEFKGTDRTVSHGLATATFDSDLGVLKIISNTVDVKINQKDNANHDYTAVLEITGAITIEFTPNPGALAQDIENLAVDATFYTNNHEANKYDSQLIYQTTGAKVTISGTDWLEQSNGTYQAVLDATEIATLVSLGNFTLGTYQEYNDFHALEKNITLTIAFSQAE